MNRNTDGRFPARKAKGPDCSFVRGGNQVLWFPNRNLLKHLNTMTDDRMEGIAEKGDSVFTEQVTSVRKSDALHIFYSPT